MLSDDQIELSFKGCFVSVNLGPGDVDESYQEQEIDHQ